VHREYNFYKNLGPKDMTLEQVQAKLEAGIQDSEVSMEGDGCNCSAVIVSPVFDGLSLLQRQRLVLGLVKEEIKSGELHALSVKTFTPAER
jgi:acid stress-induced BolA-like protein IbaG/YrbA